jgi:leukotriene-A4 hydrolase
MNKLLLLVALGALAYGCTSVPTQESVSKHLMTDIHSYARPEESRVHHLYWEGLIDFNTRTIQATATLHLTNSDQAEELVLDTKGLEIHSVHYADGAVAPYILGEEDPILGSPLQISITPATKQVVVKYTTSAQAEALQWLHPSQTADKDQPFLFTQSQAILARSWIPLQDSPGIRFTYEARVKVPAGMLALMSAENPKTKLPEGSYHFTMKQPIPAYLMALTVGDLSYRSLGERSGVYAEPSVLEKAAWEFAELEQMIAAAEALYGPYQWEVYDLVVLPPSFPFGGMENPRLTFATPTILAGDRSLTSLVAHELAHSWSGNLVTNATWNDFWLNEGFTVYFEMRIMEALYGRDYSEMLASLALQDLRSEVDEMMAQNHQEDTHLKLNLKGRNPDDGMTAIAYDKGYFFLRMLEQKVGREVFDAFLKDYFQQFAFQVMTTEQFEVHLRAALFEAHGREYDSAEVRQWIYAPGLPASLPIPQSSRFVQVDLALEAWKKGVSSRELNTSEWSSHEWLHFIRNLPADLSQNQMEGLDKAFRFTHSGNSEILTAWMMHVIRHRYVAAYPQLEKFLVHTGRRKFLSPLYGELVKTEEGKQMAREIYAKARPNYHFVATSTFDKLLEVQP